MWHWGDPRRTFWASCSASAVAAQVGVCVLWNNSPGQHLICVRDLVNPAPTANAVASVTWFEGSTGTQNGSTYPIVTGDAQPVGLTFSSTIAAAPATFINYAAPNVLNGNTDFGPLVVLLPGWSMRVYGATANTVFTISFRAEWRWVWELPAIPENPIAPE
jgi:hypothetical protein